MLQPLGSGSEVGGSHAQALCQLGQRAVFRGQLGHRLEHLAFPFGCPRDQPLDVRDRFDAAVFAFAPRWAPTIGWVPVGYASVVGQLGAGLGLPDVVIDLSPFTHVPAVPASDLDLLPLGILSCVAVVLYAIGVVGLRRRDLTISA